MPRLRFLRAVLERRPVSFCPHAHIPEYRLTFYVERLACGHEIHTFPQADPLTAKRRVCQECAEQVVLRKAA